MKYLFLIALFVSSLASAQPRNGSYFPPGASGGGSTNLSNFTNAFVVFIGAGGTNVETSGLQTLASVPGNVILIPYKTNGYTFGTVYVTNSVQIWNLGSMLKLATAVNGAPMFDTRNNTNWVFDGVLIDGQEHTTNFVNLLPAAVGDIGGWPRNNTGPRHGFYLNMMGGDIHGCRVSGMDGVAYAGYNPTSSVAYFSPITKFYQNSAFACRIGADFPSLTNLLTSPEYLLISGFDAAQCTIGARATAGNIQMVNSHLLANGVGYFSEGGDNGNHGCVTGCNMNHNVFGIFGYFMDSGEIFTSCEIKANGNDVYLDTCSGIKITDCSLHSSINYTATGSGQDNSIMNNTYSGSWATAAKITNSASTGNIIIGGNHSINVVGNTDGSFTNGTDFFRVNPANTASGSASNSLIAWIPTNAAPFLVSTNTFATNTVNTAGNQRTYIRANFLMTGAAAASARITLKVDNNADGSYEITNNVITLGGVALVNSIMSIQAFVNPNAKWYLTNNCDSGTSAVFVSGELDGQ